jgi:monofunctional biosynthetic peptidoglycan transglycosylase
MPVLLRTLRAALLVLIVVPPVWSALYAVVPPGTTPLLVFRTVSGKGLVRSPVPLEAIAPALRHAVIASEDQRFCLHHGFDWTEIERAFSERARRERGASTLSQQVAKNVFLWPGKSWLRKGLEAYFTVFVEAFWSKHRILETYLNVAEWGPGIYGAEAAARYHFGTTADALSGWQAARLAAILPNPVLWRAEPPGPYVRAAAQAIEQKMATVAAAGLTRCVDG